MKASNLGVFQENGMITTSWDAQEGVTNEALLGIVVRPSHAIALADVLSINSRMTEAEAYNMNSEKMAVSLSTATGELGRVSKLYQNQPNPFRQETVIGLSLPTSKTATLQH